MTKKKKTAKRRVYLVETTVAYSIENCGDGSAYPTWFLDTDDADLHNESQLEGWGETCTGTVETFKGSDIHKEAVENSGNLCRECGNSDEDYCRCEDDD